MSSMMVHSESRDVVLPRTGVQSNWCGERQEAGKHADGALCRGGLMCGCEMPASAGLQRSTDRFIRCPATFLEVMSCRDWGGYRRKLGKIHPVWTYSVLTANCKNDSHDMELASDCAG